MEKTDLAKEELLALLLEEEEGLNVLEEEGLNVSSGQEEIVARDKTVGEPSPEKTELVKDELLALLLEEEGLDVSTGQEIVARDKTVGEPPLSFAQQRLWFLDQLTPESPSYNIPAAVRITGTLRIAVLEQTFTEIVQRHEVLRTTFAMGPDGQQVQIIETSDLTTRLLPIVDLQALPTVVQSSEMQRLATEEAHRPFDLVKGPLLRLTLLRLNTETYMMLLTMHHIISDGWSIAIFLQEIASLYEAFSTGKPSSLPALPIQYADFAIWQRQWFEEEGVLETQLNYWKQQLTGAPPVLELPTDHPRPIVQSFKGNIEKFELNEALTKQLKILSQRSGTSLFMTLLAAFVVLLSRYSGQKDLVVGSPIANRNRSETEFLMGFFVNTLLMRITLPEKMTFRDLLVQTRQVALEAYDHQDIPFEQLVEALQPARNLSHSPLFQVMFALQNAPTRPLEMLGLNLEVLEVETTISKFDLTLDIDESGSVLKGTFEYNTDLFEVATIIRMIGHFKTLLAGIIANPEYQVAQLPLLSQTEKYQLLNEWNDTQVSYPQEDQCIPQLFEAQVKRTPTAVAVVFQNQQITYQDLNVRANQLAYHLQTLGVQTETLVGLCVERSLEMVIGLLGVLKAGGAYVPLDPNYPQQRLAFILEDSQIRVLLSQSHLKEKLPSHQAQVINLDTFGERGPRLCEDNPVSQVAPSNLAYVIYTSGSTGQPKGVAIEHHSTVVLLSWAKDIFTPKQLSGVLASTSICFDLSVFEIFVPLSWGGTTIVVENALHLPQLSNKCNVTLVNTVPSAIAELVRTDGIPASVPVINLAGEALKKELVQKIYQQETVHHVFNLYGPSEDTTYSTFALLEKGNPDSPSIGRPIANTQIYILDRHLQPTPIGVQGELHIGGKGLARGYLNRPELTAKKFIKNPFSEERGSRLYKTGDLARYLPDGNIEYLGRIDNQVKIRGFRIELGEIEAVLGQHVQENAVIVHETSATDKRLVAYIVPHQEQTLENTELRAFLKERLPDYMVPSALVTLDALPLTPNGKIDRRALSILSVSHDHSEEQFVAPRTPEEELLAGIFAEVLSAPQVGVHDNFFELGGHSLLATQVMSRIRDTFEVELPLRELFESPTIGDLSEHLSTTRRSAALPPVTLVNREQPLSLSFAQQRLWFLNQLEGESATYNIPVTLRLEGPLHQNALLNSLQTLVQRHENLRTAFPTRKGQPVVQMVEKPFQLSILSLTALSLEQQQPEVQRLVNESADRPFNLETGPLFRATLLQLGSESDVLLLNMHHIIADGWSIWVLLQELSALYEAFSLDKPSPLPPLSIQYIDFANWQRQWLTGEVLEQQLSYWKQQLAGVPTLLELPTDHPRPPMQSYQGANLHFSLSPELTEQLHHLTQQAGTTLFMTLLAAFATLLSRYSGQSDIVIGSPIANRTHSFLESLIGLFVNTLMLRLNFEDNPPFIEVLQQARRVALEAYAHQDIPFEQLVEELQPERSLSHSPLFQVMFDLQSVEMPMELVGLSVTPVEVESTIAKFDLTLSMEETAQGLIGVFEYSTDLFERATIERLSGHFLSLLTGMVENPPQLIHELPLLTEAEQQQLLAWNETTADYPRDKTIAELFEEQVEQTPDAVAVVFEDQQLTYRELNTKANQIAHYLRRRIMRNEFVGILEERGIDFLAAMLGILKAGGAFLPIDPSYPDDRVLYMVTNSQIHSLITRRTLFDKIATDVEKGGYLRAMLCLDGEKGELRGIYQFYNGTELANEPKNNPSCLNEPTDIAYMLYTSGSTGLPKGAMVRHNGAVNHIYAQFDQLAFHQNSAFLQSAPSSSDISVWQFLAPLLIGGRTVIVDFETVCDSAKLFQVIKSQQVTLIELVPVVMQGVLDLVAQLPPEERVLPALEWAMVTGEAVSTSLVNQWLQTYPNIKLVNAYGPTEAADDICQAVLDKPLPKEQINVPIGKPLANLSLYVLDAQQQLLPIGVYGEIGVAGVGVGAGYWRDEKKTRASFVNNPYANDTFSRVIYRTGDLGRWLPDGSLEFIGRLDDQVKIRGFRIELGEIEAVLGQHPLIAQNTVIVNEASQTDKRLVAYLLPNKEQVIEKTALRTFLEERLPVHMIPSAFVTLEALPLTPNGKIDRRALAKLSVSYDRSEEQFMAPRTPEEELLAGIWAEVLDVSRVGVHDNFFELGGHSLLATQVISRLRDTFEIELPVRVLFEAPTIQALSEHLGTARRESALPPITLVNRNEPLPLSFAQQRLWFLNQLEGESATYNIPDALRLEGPLHQNALLRSLQTLVQRHENLRTAFPTLKGQPVIQIVDKPFQVNTLSLTALSLEKQQLEVQWLMNSDANRPFDLETGPLFRASLLQLSAESHVLLLNMHHIISDDWSVGVLIQEWRVLYEASVQGQPSPLPALPIQYVDFANWQRQWLRGDVLEEQLHYWKQQLAGAPALLELPTDHPRPPVQRFQGASLPISLSKELSVQLKHLSQQNGTTLFMTLLSAFATLLSRYSGQSDIVIGSPIANRTHSQTESLIGFFVNTLVLRLDLSDNPPFETLLQQARRVALEAYTHQDIPFEQLVEGLQPARDISHSPLFQVMLVLQNAPQSNLELSGLTLTPLETESTIAKFDLTLLIEETDQGIVGGFEYNTDLFEATTIERLREHLYTLLTGLVANPQQPIHELPLLTEAEQQQLLAWNDTATDYPRDQTIVDLFEEQVEQTPDAVAVVFEDQQLTYRELNIKANQLAHYLQNIGVKPEVLVGICVERSLEMVSGLLGILKAGGAYLPLDLAYPKARLAFMLEDAKVPVLLTQESLTEKLPETKTPVVCLDLEAETLSRYHSENIISGVGPENLAYVIYTSGSTGKPKGVLIPHSNVTRLFAATQSMFHFNNQDVWTLFHSYAFDFSVWELWGALLYGGTLVVVPYFVSRSPKAFYELLGNQGVTVLNQTPSAFRQVIQIEEQQGICSDLNLRVVIFGGEALEFKSLTPWFERHGDRIPQLVNMYGITETTVHVTYRPLTKADLNSLGSAIGIPIPDLQAYILDSHHMLSPIGVPGELHIGGAGLARGYLNRPELTVEKFIKNPFSEEHGSRLYKTGDLARYRPDGNIEYLGRIDNQVKIRGFRIELSEIEAVLGQYSFVKESAVVVHEISQTDKRLVAYLVPYQGQEIEKTELRAFLTSLLPDYMIPSALVTLESLPLTPNGKIDRRALSMLSVNHDRSEEQFVAPRTHEEELLAGIWADVLSVSVSRVGVHDNFFEVGGHSLLATQLMSRIRDSFEVELPLRFMFEKPTIAELAESIETFRMVVQPITTDISEEEWEGGRL